MRPFVQNDLVRLRGLHGPEMLVMSDEASMTIDGPNGEPLTVTMVAVVWYCDHKHLHNAVIDTRSLELHRVH